MSDHHLTELPLPDVLYIPPSNKVKSVSDIPLNSKHLFFNAGHMARLDKSGLADYFSTDDRYQVEKDNKREIWANVNWETLLLNHRFQDTMYSDPDKRNELMTVIIHELKQTHIYDSLLQVNSYLKKIKQQGVDSQSVNQSITEIENQLPDIFKTNQTKAQAIDGFLQGAQLIGINFSTSEYFNPLQKALDGLLGPKKAGKRIPFDLNEIITKVKNSGGKMKKEEIGNLVGFAA